MNYDHFALAPPSDQLIGHRGIAALAPENTMASFRLAASQKVSWIEFDVRLTKDNELIIFHDDRLERTTNGKGFVYDHNLSELLNLDAGAWFAPHFAGETIPVFSEAFTELLHLGLQCNIEMKFPPNPSATHIETLATKLCQVLKKVGLIQAFPLISSFEWQALEWVRREFPNAPIGFLTEACSAELIAEVAKTPNAALHCHYQGLTTELLNMAHRAQVPILTYTVNEANIANHLFNQRVFGIFSDNPLELRRS